MLRPTWCPRNQVQLTPLGGNRPQSRTQVLTYQLQPRGFRFLDGPPTFPAACVVTLTLSPRQTFGGVEGPSRILAITSDRHFEFDANTGRSFAASVPPLPPVDVSIAWRNARVRVEGSQLTHEFHCANAGQLDRTVAFLFYTAPLALSQTLPDAITCVGVDGRVGAGRFRWEHIHSVDPQLVATAPVVEQRVADAVGLIGRLGRPEMVRVRAALHYLHVAKRLWQAPEAPWEFAAEAILNYAKALEILFGSDRDAVRLGLQSVSNLDLALVESVFIPVLLLRSHLDIAHPRLALVDTGRRHRLYYFVLSLEEHFTNLLSLVLQQVQDGTLILASTSSLELSGAEQRALDSFLSELPSDPGAA